MKNRDAVAYAVFRWADIHGRPVSYYDAQDIVREMELVCPKLTALIEQPWRKPRVKVIPEPLPRETP